MDLILWRHAEAEPHVTEGDEAGDLKRALTPKGKRHAARVGAWLHRQLPDDLRVLSSPAKRCVQTVEALGREGYATAGFVGNTFFCNKLFGVDRGFAHYDDLYENRTISLFAALDMPAWP